MMNQPLLSGIVMGTAVVTLGAALVPNGIAPAQLLSILAELFIALAIIQSGDKR